MRADTASHGKRAVQPENPPEPGSYELTTVAYPTDGGWTSPTAKSLRPGAKVTLSCSPYSNYAFECWKDEAGNIVTTDREWVLTMPHGNVRYTAVFKFKPETLMNRARPLYTATLQQNAILRKQGMSTAPASMRQERKCN